MEKSPCYISGWRKILDLMLHMRSGLGINIREVRAIQDSVMLSVILCLWIVVVVGTALECSEPVFADGFNAIGGYCKLT